MSLMKLEDPSGSLYFLMVTISGQDIRVMRADALLK